MQVFNVAALTADRRAAREREARSERLRRRARAVEPALRTAPGRCAPGATPLSRPVA